MKFDCTDSLLHLKQGHILLCPTDTVWGISCDATNESAVNKIILLKKRTADKSFIVLVNSLDMLGLYIDSFPNFAVDILEYSELPVTIIFPKGVKLSPNVAKDDGSIAIRLVKPINEEAKFCSELIRKLNKPIVSTSANFSNEATPRTFKEINAVVKTGVDFIVPYFQNNPNLRHPSKIIKMNDDGTFKVLR